MVPQLIRTARNWFSARPPWLTVAVALALAAPGVQAQQNGRVTGQVVDGTSGAPLAQVQVYLDGTGLGTLSRQDGRFLILNVPAGSYTLKAERVGQKTVTQQIDVAADQTVEVNLSMETQALGLDEIVVTGTAGAARRREVGNSIAQINTTDVPDKPVAVTDLLTASAPGISVTAGGGETGQGKQIRLRGNSSVSMSNQPIIYIDGVRMMSEAFPQVATPDYRSGRGANVTSSPLDDINPNDIERIEVIKGSAATTLYGTEASAGVIQIFTKKGSQGAPVWTMETQQGTSWERKFGVNGVDYLNMEPWTCTGPFSCGTYAQQSYNSTYSASVRGGGQNLQYFSSGELDQQAGILPLDRLKKYVVRGNFTFTPIEDLQFQWNTAYTNQYQKNTPTGNNAQGLTLNVFRQERNYFGTGDPEAINAVLGFDIQQRIERFTTGGTATYSPLANLTNRLTIGYDFSQQENRNLRPYGFEQFPQGGLLNDTWQKRILTFDYVGSYNFGITEALHSNFSWGGQAIGQDTRDVQAWGEGFPGNAEPTVSAAATTLGFEDRSRVWNAGFFLQNVFDVDNRYFLTLGARVDGNSAFGSGFGLQFYPKASASWVISDESWWSPSFGQVKLRTAYGQSGRAPGAFDAVRTWDPQGWAGDPAFVPQNVGNADLGPEVTGEFEAGFDASWFDDRLSSTFTYYHQITQDALMDVGQIPSLGFTGSQLQNVGKLKNSGIELGINASPVRGAEWGWDVGVNISTNHSEVLDLGGAAPFQLNDGGWVIEGYPVPVERADLVRNPDAIAAPEFALDSIVGAQLPTRTVSLNTSVRVPGGIRLAATGEYRGGNVMEVNPISVSRSVRSPLCFPYYVDPQNSITLKDGIPAVWQARCTPKDQSSHGGAGYWYNADYFKLRSVSATIPMDFAFPDRFTSSTLTLSLDNSFLWMKDIPWMDPEILGNQAANATSIGHATERVPSPIQLRLSLRVTF